MITTATTAITITIRRIMIGYPAFKRFVAVLFLGAVVLFTSLTLLCTIVVLFSMTVVVFFTIVVSFLTTFLLSAFLGSVLLSL